MPPAAKLLFVFSPHLVEELLARGVRVERKLQLSVHGGDAHIDLRVERGWGKGVGIGARRWKGLRQLQAELGNNDSLERGCGGWQLMRRGGRASAAVAIRTARWLDRSNTSAPSQRSARLPGRDEAAASAAAASTKRKTERGAALGNSLQRRLPSIACGPPTRGRRDGSSDSRISAAWRLDNTTKAPQGGILFFFSFLFLFLSNLGCTCCNGLHGSAAR